MFNYNDEANTESDNCIPFIFGCTDTIAFNYDSLANTDDDSCKPFIFGWTDSIGFNYTPYANIQDTCIYEVITEIQGCMDSSYYEYNPMATIDTLNYCINLIVNGCTNELADYIPCNPY